MSEHGFICPHCSEHISEYELIPASAVQGEAFNSVTCESCGEECTPGHGSAEDFNADGGWVCYECNHYNAA